MELAAQELLDRTLAEDGADVIVEPVVRWLTGDARDLSDSKAVLGELCRQLVAAGVVLHRLSVSTRTLHPQVLAIGYVWRRGHGDATETHRGHDILDSPQYLDSPIRRIYDGASEVRRLIEAADARLDFPILQDLKREGVTDYLMLPMRFSRRRLNTIAFATDRPGGFLEHELRGLRDLVPMLALVLEVNETQRIAAALLETYLGRDAGRRVLGGLVRRGDGITIAAALWYCDLRGFTSLSERLPRDAVIALLNDYFECMVKPVHAYGGDVLKFIGDAMLAIFPIADDLDRDRACLTALAAARQALSDLDALNARRRAEGQPVLEVGLALHTGALMYGNIGAPDRLDFTVIGPAVNLVTRLEGLCAALGHRLLASARFASPCGLELSPVGRFRLRGIDDEQAVFTLPDPVDHAS